MAFEYQVVDSELLVDGPIFGVRRDTLTMPEGETANRDLVEHFGAVAVVAFDGRKIALVRQYRRSVDRRLWELPAGLLDVADEDPLTAAKRELLEEAGLGATKWSVLVDLVTSPGFSDEAVRVYLATGLYKEERPAGQHEEADLENRWVALTYAVDMVLKGEISNGIAIAGIMAADAVERKVRRARSVQTPFELRPTALAERRKAEGFGDDMKKQPDA